MTTLAEILSFSPARLRVVREVIAAEHPTIGERADAVPVGADLLRMRIEQLSGDAEALKALAFELTPSQLVFVARSVGTWTDLREAVAVIVRTRLSSQLGPALWRAWESFPRSEITRELLREAVRRFGGSCVGFARYSDEVGRWMEHQEPGRAIVGWLDETGALRVERLSDAGGSPIRAGSALEDHLGKCVVRWGSREQVAAHSDDELLDLVHRTRPAEQVEQLQNYLGVLSVASWSGAVLEAIREEYGMPGLHESLSNFWSGVSQQDQKAFRRHFIAADLAEAFKGDTERHRYWSRWADRDEILDVRRGNAGDVPWARMTFDGFAVVEFFQVNNAAYFLPAKEVRSIPWKSASSPSDLKVRLERPVQGQRDNRLVHRAGWQGQCDQMMGAWKRRFS